MVWSLERGGSWRAVVAGVMVGLAWNTKYHGWFALVIVAMAIVARGFVGRHNAGERAWTVMAAKRWLVSAVVAGLCYLPWAAFIQAQPGYRRLVVYFATCCTDWPVMPSSRSGDGWRTVRRASVPLVPRVTLRTGPRGSGLVRHAAILCAGVHVRRGGTAALLVLLGVPGCDVWSPSPPR
jgi:hypothetical protein